MGGVGREGRGGGFRFNSDSNVSGVNPTERRVAGLGRHTSGVKCSPSPLSSNLSRPLRCGGKKQTDEGGQRAAVAGSQVGSY